ncbi:MAG: cob(I)yrinic acid a,c-diamide adenosyltransferase [Saprospiraceae bacterium]|nr:cob(I)yrinic acid a,c-diamide adenosyltransferase [Saprospiraceae bacterium]
MAFRIYTKTGDQGETGLFGGKRLSKAHIRIDSYGTVDELNSCLGLVRDHLEIESIRQELLEIQSLLFTIGSNLASDPEKKSGVPALRETEIEKLEKAIDRMEESLPPLKNFILPGGHPAVSFIHLARTVCRRAERITVALAELEPVEETLIKYLNRLSDYLFVLARYTGHKLGVSEIPWIAG